MLGKIPDAQPRSLCEAFARRLRFAEGRAAGSRRESLAELRLLHSGTDGPRQHRPRTAPGRSSRDRAEPAASRTTLPGIPNARGW